MKRRIDVEYWCDSPPVKGSIEDMSESGMFIDTNQPLPAGSRIRYRFLLQSGQGSTEVSGIGTVVWAERTGMGVEFSDLGDSERANIRFFVAAVLFGHDPGSLDQV